MKKPAKFPEQIGISYNAELQRIVRSLRRDVKEHIPDLLESITTGGTSWVDDIKRVMWLLRRKWQSPQMMLEIERIARKFVISADRFNEKQNAKLMDISVDIFRNNKPLQEFVNLCIYDNTRLITSISDKYLSSVEQIVSEHVRLGSRHETTAKRLTEQFGVESRRAKFIARDQTAKVNGQLNMKRQQAAGFEYFRWLTSHDRRVRHRHVEIADKVTKYGKGIYRWDDLPLSDSGVPIAPGTDYQCRCDAIPVSNDKIKKGR